jgi:hypothetical protein
MKRRTSLGDFISALYDTVDISGAVHSVSEVVTACTLDLLLRQRRRNLIAALCDPAQADVLH